MRYFLPVGSRLFPLCLSLIPPISRESSNVRMSIIRKFLFLLVVYVLKCALLFFTRVSAYPRFFFAKDLLVVPRLDTSYK